jgi:hypothetical protein
MKTCGISGVIIPDDPEGKSHAGPSGQEWQFTPEDFETQTQPFNDRWVRGEAAILANAKLADWLNKAPKVYGLPYDGEEKPVHWDGLRRINDTHTARLVDIKELPKEPCKHEPKDLIYKAVDGRVVAILESPCRHCGKKLKVVWDEADSLPDKPWTEWS